MNTTECLCQTPGEPKPIPVWWDYLLGANQSSQDPRVSKRSRLRTHVQFTGSLRIFKANRLWTGRLTVGELVMQEPIHFSLRNDV